MRLAYLCVHIVPNSFVSLYLPQIDITLVVFGEWLVSRRFNEFDVCSYLLGINSFYIRMIYFTFDAHCLVSALQTKSYSNENRISKDCYRCSGYV